MPSPTAKLEANENQQVADIRLKVGTAVLRCVVTGTTLFNDLRDLASRLSNRLMLRSIRSNVVFFLPPPIGAATCAICLAKCATPYKRSFTSAHH